MSKIEVLVTTMHQSDFSKYSQMNLQTDAVIANQTDKNEYAEMQINGCNVKLVSTDTRGTSRNRNIAMAHTSQKADFFLFSDDDLVFNDRYEQTIVKEFENHPEAEAIKFNIHDISETRKISMHRIEQFEKATRRNMSASGVCGLVVKSDVLKKHGLHFQENFGPGTEHYCGEDTIFLMEMLDKKVKFYRSPEDIAGIDQTKSSWFTGYDEKYFRNAGLLLKTMFPNLCYLLAVRSAYRFLKRNNCTLNFWGILKCYYRGILGDK